MVGNIRFLNKILFFMVMVIPFISYALIERFSSLGGALAISFSVVGVNLILFPVAVFQIKRVNL